MLLVIAVAVTGWIITVTRGSSFRRKDAMMFFLLYFAAYIIISYCVTGVFSGIFLLNHHLYVVNFIIVLILLGMRYPAFFQDSGLDISGSKWLRYIVIAIAVILVLSLVLINIHGELNGAHDRFPDQ